MRHVASIGHDVACYAGLDATSLRARKRVLELAVQASRGLPVPGRHLALARPSRADDRDRSLTTDPAVPRYQTRMPGVVSGVVAQRCRSDGP
jgi:hypothetical protein